MRNRALSGIYAIRNDVNAKVYVGSSQDLEDRWKRSERKLRAGCYENKLVQDAWNAHGGRGFTFELLQAVPNLEYLAYYEQFWMDHLGAWHGYGGLNLRAKATPARGYRYKRVPKSFLQAGPYYAGDGTFYDANGYALAHGSRRFTEKLATLWNRLLRQ